MTETLTARRPAIQPAAIRFATADCALWAA